ncbi:unnamed protein product [Ilex paraguariensis]|uniref:Uncharacterized protein n=1 Tax=Ilex paraguariensis TaxID=185542 RepID=A0ABC8SMX7_9AQUA
MALYTRSDSVPDTALIEELLNGDEGNVITNSFDNPFPNNAAMPTSTTSNKTSGKMASPSKCCITCLMLGLDTRLLCEQSKPNFKTNFIFFSPKSPPNLG